MQSRKQDRRCTNGHMPIASLHTSVSCFCRHVVCFKDRIIDTHTETDLTVFSPSLSQPRSIRLSHKSRNKSAHPENQLFLQCKPSFRGSKYPKYILLDFENNNTGMHIGTDLTIFSPSLSEPRSMRASHESRIASVQPGAAPASTEVSQVTPLAKKSRSNAGCSPSNVQIGALPAIAPAQIYRAMICIQTIIIKHHLHALLIRILHSII